MSAAKFTWDESPTKPVDGYNVYIKEGLGALTAFLKHNSSVIPGTEYTATNLSPGTYQAYDTAVRGSEESDPSNIVTFTIEFNNIYKPQNLSSTVAGSDVTLGWDYVPGITTYNVYMKPSGGSYTKQNTNVVTENSFDITGLAADTYTFYIASVYNGSEINSDTAEFTI